MVPNGWESLTFNNLLKAGDIEQIQDGNHGNSHPKSSDFVAEGIPFVMARNLKKGSVNLESCAYITKDQADSLRIGFAKPGDILLSHKGTIGQVAIVQDCKHYMMLTPQVTYYRVAEDSKLLATFLYQFFLSHEFQGRLKNLAAQSTRSYLGITAQKKLSILLPPLPEQQKIAKILTTWDKAIDTTERLIANSKQQKKALMQQLLTGKKRLLDDNGERFEGEWEEVKLGDISNITTGSSNRVDSSLDAEYAFFDRSLDVRRSSIYLFDSEAVIVAGEGQEFVPKHFIGKFDLHQRTYAIMDFKNTIGKFLYYYITFNRHYFLAQAVGSTVKSLRLPMFVKMPIKLPSVEEQQKIAAVLTNADKEIELLEQQLADLQQEKKALMQVLLTGKKRVVINDRT